MLGFRAVGFTTVGMSAVAIAAVSASAISADLNASYRVLSLVAGNLTGAYSVHGLVSADRIGAFNVLTQVSADLSAAYGFRAGVLVDLIGAYQVAEAVHPYVRSQARTYLVTDEPDASGPVFRMSAGAKLDYSFDWSPYLAAVDDQLVTYDIDVPAALVGSGKVLDGMVATVWLQAPVAGYSYRIECKITTEQGREDSRAITVEVIA